MDSDDDFLPPEVPVKDSSVVEPAEPRLVHEAFSVPAADTILHCQILKLVDQWYVWAALGDSTPLNELSMAVNTHLSDIPSATELIGGYKKSASTELAKRLSMRTGKSVVASCNIPDELAVMQSFAEKTLVAKLMELSELHGGDNAT